MKKDLQKAKKLCEEACDEVYMKYDADLSYDHYDAEVQTFYLFQSDHTHNQAEFYMLDDLTKKIKKINKRWMVGIKYHNLEKYEADMYASRVKNKEL
ncbi:MAG TPA: hypothetical protein DF712_07360 [Balneola sp.]|nr:hypothetical protein [Balneola sp.]